MYRYSTPFDSATRLEYLNLRSVQHSPGDANRGLKQVSDAHPPFDDDYDDEGSITRVIRNMQQGDKQDAALLWNRFYYRLRLLVKDRLPKGRVSVSDEEDVALESLTEMFKGLLEGKYPALGSREAFWRLLVTMATRNVIDQINREKRAKRGSGRVHHESAFTSSAEHGAALFEQVASSTAAPDVQVMIAERCTQLLESLSDHTLRQIAIMKTAGWTNQEVAEAVGISLRSVERRLAEIRDCWDNVED